MDLSPANRGRRPTARRRPAPTLAALGLATTWLLAGCSSGQDVWAEAMEDVDGVVSVEYLSRDNQLVGPDDHEMTVRLEDDLDVEQVRRIAEASCARDAPLTRLTLTTAAPDTDEAGSVTLQNAAPYDTACLAEETVAGFATASTAMGRLLPGYDGDFSSPGFTAGAAPSPDDPDRALVVVTTSAERARLLDALRALHDEGAALPLRYVGWWDEDRDPGTSATRPLVADLSPDADMAVLAPLISGAFELGVDDVEVTDRAITVTPPPGAVPDVAAWQHLADQAAGAGVGLEVGTPSEPDATTG